MSTLRRFALLTLLLLAFAACAGPQKVTERPVGPPPFGPDLRPGHADANDANPWHRWVVGSDTDGADQRFLQALDGPEPIDPWARFGRAETALQRADFGAAFANHLALLTAAPDHRLARWSALRLWHLRDVVPTWSEDVARLIVGLEGRPMEPATRAWLGFLALHTTYALSRADGRPAVFDGTGIGFAQRWTLLEPLTIFPWEGWERAMDTIGGDRVLADRYTIDGFERELRSVIFDGPGGNVSFRFTGVHLLESWVELPADTDVIVQLYSESLIEVWVDDALLFERTPGTGTTRRRFAEPLRMGRGVHRLRVKLGTTTGQESFTLLLTPADGRPLAATFSPRPPSAPPTLGALVRASTPPNPGFFPLLTPDDAWGHPVPLWLLALSAQDEGDLATARDALTMLQVAAPRFPMLPMTWARLAREDAEAPPQTRFERALGFYREAADLDPAAHYARLELSSLLLELGQPDEALQLLTELHAQLPGNVAVDWQRFQHFRDRGWTAQAQDALLEALEASSADCRLINARWEQWERLQTWPEEANLPPEFFGCDTTWERLANAYDVPRGNFEQALERYDVLVARNPSAPTYRTQRAALLRRLGRQSEANAELEAVAALVTDPTEIRLQQTDALTADGKKPEAITLLQNLLAETPANYGLRRRLSELRLEPILDGLAVDGQKVIARYLANPTGEDASAAYLLDWAGTRVYEDGSSLTITHNIIRVNNKEGMDQYGEVEIPGNALLLWVRTVKPDGRGLEPELIQGKPSISMPNLEPGDFIEYAYLQGEDGSLVRRGSFRGFRFYFNIFDAPLLHSEYEIELPTSFEPVIDIRHGAPAPKVERVGDYNRYRFVVEDGPRATSEPNAVLGSEHLPSIRVAHKISILDMQRTWRDQMLVNAEPTDQLRRLVRSTREALGANGKVTPERLARALHAVVLQRVTDDGSGLFAQPAAHTLASGSGDRLIVLKTLFDIAGIDNDIILGRTLGSDLSESAVPEIESYNLAILRTRVGGREFWLDPTTNHAIFGHINPILQGAQGLTLADVPASQADQALYVTIPTLPDGSDHHEVDVRVTIDADGNAVGNAVETFRGADASLYRRIFDRYTDRDKLRQDFGQGLAESFPGAVVDHLEVDHFEDDEAPLVIRYTFRSTALARADGKTLILDRVQFPSSLSTTWASLPERKMTMALLEPMHLTFTLRYTFPEGHEVKSHLAPIDAQTPFGSYRLETFEVEEPNTVGCKRTVVLPIQRIAPADYPAFRKFAQQVDQADRIHLESRP